MVACELESRRFPSSVHRIADHHLRNSKKVIALGFVARDQVIGGDHRLGAVRAHLIMPAIVQKDYVAASNLFCDLALDHLGGRCGPVVAGYVPHDWFHAELSRRAEDPGAASAKRRTEEIGMF